VTGSSRLPTARSNSIQRPFEVHDKHLSHPDLGIEADLVVRLIIVGADLDDQLGALRAAVGLVLRPIIGLIRLRFGRGEQRRMARVASPVVVGPRR
jgi:hypothetical protein